jgi:hypothetical protein
MIENIISILSGMLVPVILAFYTIYQNKITKAKLYMDSHELYSSVIIEMKNNFASFSGPKYDLKKFEYLILGGRKYLNPIYNYIKKCYKKNKIPDKAKIQKYVDDLMKNHSEIYEHTYIFEISNALKSISKDISDIKFEMKSLNKS